jgi:hypothetical protein
MLEVEAGGGKSPIDARGGWSYGSYSTMLTVSDEIVCPLAMCVCPVEVFEHDQLS